MKKPGFWTLHTRDYAGRKQFASITVAMKTGGIVLCGGQSRRMGGPKAWLPFGPEFLLTRVARLVGEAVRPVVVVAAPDQSVPALPPEVAVVRDEQKGRGPLQGLAAGLNALRGRVDAAFVASCDLPLLGPALIQRLMELLGDHAACVPFVDSHLHPLAATYHVEVADAVQRLLAANRLRASALIEIISARIVQPHELTDLDPQLLSLRNVNTPDDYEAALRLLTPSPNPTAPTST